jgi:preprotein translocase subunit SecA
MAGRGVDIKLGGELSEETLTQVGRVLHRAGIDPYNMSFDEIAQALEKIPQETYALDAEHVERFKKHMHDRVRTRELGGLRVVGTERHEARRIDNQLRGRSGRQGDAGSSRFYVSIEDEIMRRMGGKGLMDRVWVEDIPIQHGLVTNAIEQAQIKMEGYNFDIRKHLLEYDDVLNKQREVIYGQRHRILTKADLRDDLRGWIEEELTQILGTELKSEDHAHSRLLAHLDALLPGFWLTPEELWAPYSLSLVQRDLATDGRVPTTASILNAAKSAHELARDFLTQSVVPEVVAQLEQQYKPGWDEVEELAKNTLTTIRQEAADRIARSTCALWCN